MFCFNESAAFQTRRSLLADLKTNRHLCCFTHSLYCFPLVGKTNDPPHRNQRVSWFIDVDRVFFLSQWPSCPKMSKMNSLLSNFQDLFVEACRHYRSYLFLLFALFWQRRLVMRSPVLSVWFSGPFNAAKPLHSKRCVQWKGQWFTTVLWTIVKIALFWYY